METFRSTATALATAAAALILAGCGHGSDPTPDPLPAQPVRTSATAPVQPVAAWLPASTRVLDSLTTDLSGLTDSMTAGTAPDTGGLTADATAGLRLAAPAGHPALDRAWDAVMNDYLLVAGDLDSGDSAQTSADLGMTGTDMETLQRESARL